MKNRTHLSPFRTHKQALCLLRCIFAMWACVLPNYARKNNKNNRELKESKKRNKNSTPFQASLEAGLRAASATGREAGNPWVPAFFSPPADPTVLVSRPGSCWAPSGVSRFGERGPGWPSLRSDKHWRYTVSPCSAV